MWGALRSVASGHERQTAAVRQGKAGRQAGRHTADTQATMTAPDNTFDVIVVGGGISGRRISPALTGKHPPLPTPEQHRRLCTPVRDARRFSAKERMRSARHTTVARRGFPLCRREERGNESLGPPHPESRFPAVGFLSAHPPLYRRSGES